SDGRWIAIACTSDKIFARLAELMGKPELAAEDRWGPVRQRLADRDEVDAVVTAWTSQHDRDTVLRLCEEGQVPCGPVYAVDEIFQDPQYAARGNIVRMEDERIGTLAIPNVVPRLTDTPGAVKWLGPALGADNDSVYRGLLGLTAADLERLRGSGTI
ncbi:MAG: CoA transferase, partial [Rhodospirillales bacterium]|nr:CoA transferase [Rhodospirillales bacterium]